MRGGFVVVLLAAGCLFPNLDSLSAQDASIEVGASDVQVPERSP
jgi:hypothetical protein